MRAVVVCVCVLMLCCPLVCFGKLINIPGGMPIADFNSKVVGKYQRQVYLAVPVINGAPIYASALGYQFKLQQLGVPNNYKKTAIFDVANVAHATLVDKAHDTLVDRANGTLVDKAHDTLFDRAHGTLVDKAHDTLVDKAHGTLVDKAHDTLVDRAHARTVIYWSSDVDSYTLVLRCYNNDGLPVPQKCKPEDTEIGLSVPQTLDKLKWSMVLEDLEAADVEFGDDRFQWFFNFNYGKSTCVGGSD
ncbi:hypothetical protein MAR_008440 [Mya arenaria]|uniref:Uncharacterized protein n=1 Tax=Mya arenaria TaxID=6604 RepID=A0ABY7DW10_MYAAR|nr:hypothetical protein MAR_008440 [Mya arenaria]